MKKILLSIFALSATLNILAQLFSWEEVSFFSKPVIMLALLGYYFVTSQQRSVVFLAAIVFCWAGDVLLMFQSLNELYFMAGLGAFLIGHLLYVFSYRQHKWSEGEGLLGPQKVRFALPIILAGTGLLMILYPTLGGLKVPVTIYTVVIMLMAIQALLRFGYTSTSSFALVFAGAVLFMVSDSVLAFNKFLSPVPMAGGIIMSTYCIAQLLIVLGIIQHTEARQ